MLFDGEESFEKQSESAASARSAASYNSGLEDGIAIGKRDSADKVKEQNRQILELNYRIKRLTEQLAVEAALLLLANQRSDIRIRDLSQENEKNNKENTFLTRQVTLLTGELK